MTYACDVPVLGHNRPFLHHGLDLCGVGCEQQTRTEGFRSRHWLSSFVCVIHPFFDVGLEMVGSIPNAFMGK